MEEESTVTEDQSVKFFSIYFKLIQSCFVLISLMVSHIFNISLSQNIELYVYIDSS